jgi:hypothetical protein
MRTILVLVVLSWAFLLLRLADRPEGPPAAKAETFSMRCSYERTDTVGGTPSSAESRQGPCFAPESPSIAQRLP